MSDLRFEFLQWLDRIRTSLEATPQTEVRIKNWQAQFYEDLALDTTARRAWGEIVAARCDQKAKALLYLFAHPAIFTRVKRAFGENSTFYAMMRQRIRAARNERERLRLRSLRAEILNTAGPRSGFDRWWTLLLLQELCRRRAVRLGLKRLAALAGCADPKRHHFDHAHIGRKLRDRADVPRMLWESVRVKVLRNSPDSSEDIEEVWTLQILR